MGGDTPPRWRAHLATLLKILLGLSLLWLLREKGLVDFERIGNAFSDHPFWVAAAVILHGIVFVGIGIRWRHVASAGNVRIPVGTAQKLTFISHFFSTCLPGNGAGDLVKGVLLSRSGAPFSDVLGTMAIDRVAGMSALFLVWDACMIVLAALHPQVRPVLLVALSFSLPVTALLLTSLYATARLGRAFVGIAHRLPRRGLPGRIATEASSTLLRMARCTSNPMAVGKALGLSVLVQFTLLLVAVCAARSLSIPIGILEAGAIVPLASLANALPLSPGGLGVGESAATIASAQLGLPDHAGAELILVVRMALVFWAVVGGILYATTSIPRGAAEIAD